MYLKYDPYAKTKQIVMFLMLLPTFIHKKNGSSSSNFFGFYQVAYFLQERNGELLTVQLTERKKRNHNAIILRA